MMLVWPSGVVTEEKRSESVQHIFEKVGSVVLADGLNK